MCFFFSSRRRHTRYWRDWSSDVCSSDLIDRARELFYAVRQAGVQGVRLEEAGRADGRDRVVEGADVRGSLIEGGAIAEVASDARSEERRVGKECRSRWSPYH